MGASHRKLQTSIRQIEFHNNVVLSYENFEQVKLKAIQRTQDQVGPAVWLGPVKLYGRWIIINTKL